MNESAPQGEQWDEKCVLGHCGSPSGCERDLRCRADCAAPQAAPSVAAPDGWVLVPKIGTRVKADHPRTVLNPSEYFEVTQVRAESDGNFAVRGEETCWFGLRMLAALPLPAVVQADSIAVNLVRFAGLDKHKARECEAIVRQVLANPAAPQTTAPTAAPRSEPRALGQGELPVRAEMEKVLEALEALEEARSCIHMDRTALADAHFDPKLGRVDDDGQDGLNDYDAVLRNIDAALASLRATSGENGNG